MLLYLTDCLILQDCSPGNPRHMVHLGEKKEDCLQLPSLMGQAFSPLYISSSLPLAFGWVSGGLLRHLHLCSKRESPRPETRQVRWSLCDVSRSLCKTDLCSGIWNGKL